MINKKYRDSSSFGKRMEYNIIGELLTEGLDVYTPLVDDHGVDAIIKKADGTFIELQIKARSNDAKNTGTFANIKVDAQLNDNNNEKFYYIFRSEKLKKTWILSFKEFIDNSRENKSGKNKGHRTIIFSSPNGRMKEKFDKFSERSFEMFLRNDAE